MKKLFAVLSLIFAAPVFAGPSKVFQVYDGTSASGGATATGNIDVSGFQHCIIVFTPSGGATTFAPSVLGVRGDNSTFGVVDITVSTAKDWIVSWGPGASTGDTVIGIPLPAKIKITAVGVTSKTLRTTVQCR